MSPRTAAALVAVAALALALFAAGRSSDDAAAAPDLSVTTTSDAAPDGTCDSHCTLREALTLAQTGDVIGFDIDAADANQDCDATGICTIKPLTNLPGLVPPNTTLDGYTQAGASPNTAAAFQPTNAQIRIVIDGSELGASGHGIWAHSSGNTVRGLSIVNFGLQGIKTGTFTSSVIVRGNFIGVLPDGETAVGNGIGIYILSSQEGNVIGGNEPADRNVISGNDEHGVWLTGGEGVVVANNFVGTNAAGDTAVANGSHGIYIDSAPFSLIGISSSGAGNLLSGNGESGVALSSPDAHRIRIKGNRIGTTADGQNPLPNQDHGVFLTSGAEDNTIGGEFDSDEENIIAFNGNAGVALSPSAGTDNYIDPNSTFTNGGLGTDLQADGAVLLNDPDDNDSGANHLMNYPTNISAEWDGSTLSVTATLNSEQQGPSYNIFIFVNRECDPSGYGEGERFVGSKPLQLETTTTATFTTDIAVNDIADMKFVTLSASNPQSTSEFSPCGDIVYTGPDNTPTPTPTPIATPTPTPSATAEPTVTATPTPGSQELLWGDVDCGNGVSPIDTLLVLRFGAGLEVNQAPGCPAIGQEVEVDGEARTWGDVDCSLTTTPVDSLKILRHDAGLSVEQQQGCPDIGAVVTVVA